MTPIPDRRVTPRIPGMIVTQTGDIDDLPLLRVPDLGRTIPPEAGNIQLPEPDDIWRESRQEYVVIAGVVGFILGVCFMLALTRPLWSAP